MANQLTNANVVRVARAIVYLKAAGVTVSTSATLVSLFTASSDIYFKAKNIVITPPTGEVEKIDLIGETASTLGTQLTFQNYLLEEKAWSLAKISGTVLLDLNEDNFDLAIAGGGTAVVTASYKEYNYGASDSSKKRVQGAVLVLFKHGSLIREVLLNNYFVTKLGDVKSTGADGHVERDFEGVCAQENFHDRFKD